MRIMKKKASIKMQQEVNSFDCLLVVDDLIKNGITNYTIRPGNECVWVSYGLVDCYYIIRNGRIVEVQFD
jgi:hypothetical protein